MRRLGNAFDACFSSANIYAGYMTARKNKRSKKSCLEFERHLALNLDDLTRELHEGSYKPRALYSFIIHEPKKRLISAPAFRDLVVQHAIYRIIYEHIDASFIDQNFACRVGFGVHRCSDYVQSALRSSAPDSYTLHLDIEKYFYSIDRGRLEGLLSRKIKDKRLLVVMMQFAEMDAHKGIPIGNLLSQIYALLYLNPIDHYIKRTLKVRRYARYMDDMLLIGITKKEAVLFRDLIEAKVSSELGLSFSKAVIRKVSRGINFVGYRTWRSKRFIRKHSLYKFRRAVVSSNEAAIISLLGHARRTSSLRWMLGILKRLSPDAYYSIPESYRRIYNTRARTTDR